MMNTKFVTCSFCSLIALAGTTQAAGEPSLTILEPSHGDVRQAAHIYYNAATGERVVTVIGHDGQVSGADTGQPDFTAVTNFPGSTAGRCALRSTAAWRLPD